MRILALLAVVCFALPAAADPSVGVVVSGDETVHSTGVTEVETWLSKRNFAIATGSLDQDATLTLSNCLAIADLACARGVVEKRSKSDSVVVIIANASGSKKKRDFQLSAYWITKNHDVISLQRMCNHCTKDALPKTLDELMSDLSRLVPAMTGKVNVKSVPPGLLATIDNEAIGVTPIIHDVLPGTHKVSVTRDGQVVGERTVAITVGETADVAIVAPQRQRPKGTTTVIVRKSRVVPAVMLGIGLAGIATGAVMYEVGVPTGDKPTYTDYRTPGYGVAGAGAAIAIVGTILFLRGGTTQGPTVGMTSSQTTVGWAGSF